jgi:Domain of unknown function (DUF4304)
VALSFFAKAERDLRMDTDRKTMETLLKRTCVPTLRDLGFKGSYPNFYRETGDFVALANVQFASAGGSFCVNLSYADPVRRNVYSRPETAPDKLRISQTRVTERLGAAPRGDHWFVFGSASASSYRGGVRPPEDIVAQCNDLLRTEAQDWWARMQREAQR